MKFFPFFFSVCVSAVTLGAAEVNHQVVRQNWPWDNRMRIDYVLKDATGGGHDVNVTVKHGDTVVTTGRCSGELYGVTEGAHTIWWDPMTNLTAYAEASWNDLTVELSLVDASDMYMVLDCSIDASLPVTFTNAPPAGGWNQTLYKTTKLVLRKIPAGSYVMGSPDGELGRNPNAERQHQVTLTKPFYLGIFTLTQKQYRNLENPASYSPQQAGDTVPATHLGLKFFRGDASWTKDVWPHCQEGSFLQRLTARVKLPANLDGYVFDVPTLAQWQYACRAGTTGSWNNGTTITNTTKDANLNLLGRNNAGGGSYMANAVGGLLPNAFGLYDMHGNVMEYVRDKAYGAQGVVWFKNSNPVVDPLESGDSWPYVIGCGGYWNSTPSSCRSAAFGAVGGDITGNGGNGTGARLALVWED